MITVRSRMVVVQEEAGEARMPAVARDYALARWQCLDGDRVECEGSVGVERAIWRRYRIEEAVRG